MRGTDIPPFYAGQVGLQAQRLRRAGRSVIGMHFGQPTEPPPPGVHAAALVAFTALFLFVARWGFTRDEGRTYG